MHPDREPNQQLLGVQDDAPTKQATWPGLDLLLYIYIYLFLERGEGKEEEREKEWERNFNQLPLPCPLLGTWTATQACALTGNQTGDPLVHRQALNPASHTSQG